VPCYLFESLFIPRENPGVHQIYQLSQEKTSPGIEPETGGYSFDKATLMGYYDFPLFSGESDKEEVP